MKNDFSPVFRFVICSDSHIEGIGSPGYYRLKEVIDYSLDFAEKDKHYNKIDTFFIAGDITNKGSKEEFDAFADRYLGYNLLILIRTKYDEMEEWNYNYELLLWVVDDFDYEWENDWYEGQEYVEYLGGAVLDYYENEEIL